LFENEFIDLDHGLRYAPATIPRELWDDFTRSTSSGTGCIAKFTTVVANDVDSGKKNIA
jgi:hypothetical protein